MAATADDYLTVSNRAKDKRLKETPGLTNYPYLMGEEARIIDRMVSTPLGKSKDDLMEAYRIWVHLDDVERAKVFRAQRDGR